MNTMPASPQPAGDTPVATGTPAVTPAVMGMTGEPRPVQRSYHRPVLRYGGTISHLTQGIFGAPLLY